MWDKVIVIVTVILSSYVLKQLFSSKPNKLKFNFYFFVFYISAISLAAVIWPLFLLKPKNVRNAKLAAGILKHVTKLYGLRWVLRNGEILSEDRGAVIVSNHQSSLDILGMFNIWHAVDKLTAIAKKEIFYFMPFGLAAYLAGVVFIDRSEAKNAYEKLRVTSSVLKQKTKVWLFPEGTRNKGKNEMLPFKKGAFSMAVAAEVPIIPVVFSPYYFINRKKNLFQKGHIIVQCLQPVPTVGLTQEDVPALMEQIKKSMEAAYRELSKEVLGELPKNYEQTPF